jgi:hypothetical protein
MRAKAVADAPAQKKANALQKEAKSKSSLGADEVTITVYAC